MCFTVDDIKRKLLTNVKSTLTTSQKIKSIAGTLFSKGRLFNVEVVPLNSFSTASF